MYACCLSFVVVMETSTTKLKPIQYVDVSLVVAIVVVVVFVL